MASRRPSGFGPQPIPLIEIEAYCRLRRLGAQDAEHVMEAVLFLDNEWLDAARAREAEAAKQRETERRKGRKR